MNFEFSKIGEAKKMLCTVHRLNKTPQILNTATAYGTLVKYISMHVYTSM